MAVKLYDNGGAQENKDDLDMRFESASGLLKIWHRGGVD